MGNIHDIRTGRHCVFNMHVHLVFVTKYRKNVLDGRAIEILRETFEGICRRFEAELSEFNGEEDHVHLLVYYPPKVAISVLVNSLKGASSRVLRNRYPEIATKDTTKTFCGARATLPLPAAVLRSPLSSSTLNNNKHRIEQQAPNPGLNAEACGSHFLGQYDVEDCVAEAALKYNGGGAVAYIGNSRFSWIGTGALYREHFFMRLRSIRHVRELNDSRFQLLSGTTGWLDVLPHLKEGDSNGNYTKASASA